MTIAGPCETCGQTDYELSTGGATVCPECDIGRPAERIRRLVAEVKALETAMDTNTETFVRVTTKVLGSFVRISKAMHPDIPHAQHPVADSETLLGHLEASMETLRKAEPVAPNKLRPDTVDVVEVAHMVRLMVNGYGVASWHADKPVTDEANGKEYAFEVARVLRLALGLAPSDKE